ncbi:Pentatricopeptide repeat-containing protein [Acorus gramineus]|uniref:Pentatricopeptide repeat-containing protein n=1 Tax=Acorus gramineus TaxID=55184 RepID=A0AAV9AD54_ACOGR|nr:Pentatricopeptide repeat-containing protein [Acorus gramineus]
MGSILHASPSFHLSISPTNNKHNHQPKHLQTTTTKHQALERVLEDLQLSIQRGAPVHDPHIFSSLLETCFRLRSLHHALRLHRLIPPRLLRRNPLLQSKLLRMYASHGLLDEARLLFDAMPQRTSFAYNSLISAYADSSLHEEALALFLQMDEDSVPRDRHTFPRALKACAGLGSLRLGEELHRLAVRRGFHADPFVQNALVAMYAKCGDVTKARMVFETIRRRLDPVTWNSMLTGYVRHGLLVEALHVFRGMLDTGLEPDSVAVSAVLSGFCSSRLGLEIHGWVIRRERGRERRPSVGNALISVYAERGQLRRARAVFESIPCKDRVSWNSVISAHRRDGRAVAMFERMVDSGVLPDEITFVALLSACACNGMIGEGLRLFGEMEEKYGIRRGPEHLGCVVNMLGRAGRVHEAYEFVVASEVVGSATAWGALLYACTVHGEMEVGERAAERLFELEPDNAHNFELLMRIYRGAGRAEDAEKVKGWMRERGLDD